MTFSSIWQHTKEIFFECILFFKNTLISIKSFLGDQSNHLLIFKIVSILLFLVILTLLWNEKKTLGHYNYENAKEYLILSRSLEVKKYSENFFKYLGFETNNVFVEFESHYRGFYDLFQISLKNKKSFVYSIENKPLNLIVNYNIENISIYIAINTEKLLDELPIPVSIDLGYAQINNKCFNNFGHLQSTEFFIKGQFFLKHQNIFKRESVFLDNMMFSVLMPIMSQDDFITISKNMYELPPIVICVLNRNGEIIKKSEKFDEFVKGEQSITTFQDFLESTRNYVLHDEIFFSDFKKHFLNLIGSLNKYHEETYSTIDGKVICFKFVPRFDKIFFLLEDITGLTTNKTQEFLFADIKTKLFPILSDFVIITDPFGSVDSSNCELVQNGEKINTAKTILKFFTTPENGINEINLSNNGRCLFLKISVKDKVFKIKNSISAYLDKILKILKLLDNTMDGSLNEYLKYIRFITVNIENNIKTLELGINRNYKCTSFDLIQEFNNIKKELELSFSFKNLNISISETLSVFNHKETICLLIENLFLMAFKYQFNQKNMIIEEKNDQIFVTLDGINKEEIEKIYMMFDLINSINIFSNIKEVGDKISIGFYFEKVARLS